MKRFTLVTLLAILVMAFSVEAQISTQWVKKNQGQYEYHMAGTLDSLNKSPYYDTLWTRELGMQEFNGANYYSYYVKATPTAGNPKYSIELFFSKDNITYTKIDTLVHQSTNNGAVWGTFSTNGNIKAPYMKMAIFQVALGRDDAALDFYFWSHEADENTAPRTQ